MADTKIEWADRVWNPITGCSKISEGCQHCYAERMSKRLAGRCGYPKDNPFQVIFHPDRLDEPLRWRKPSRIFVCSMGDLFHNDVPDQMIGQAWNYMRLAPWHTFMILTKRPERMKDFFNRLANTYPNEYPAKNIWLGVTAENQQRANERIPLLLQIPSTKRFVSVEPMLGPVNISRWLRISWQCSGCSGYFNGPFRNICPDCGREGWWSGSHPFNGRNTPRGPICPSKSGQGIDWVICGGETGPGARPLHPDWVRSLRDQCQAASTSFFFKSWGDYCAPSQMPPDTYRAWDYQHGTENCWQEDDPRWNVGKKNAGRLLDGVEWSQFPEVSG